MKFLFLSSLLFAGLYAQSCPDHFNYNSDLRTCLSNWTFYSTWSSANYYCTYYGGQLLSIHSSFQNSLFSQIQYKQFGDYRGWTGLIKEVFFSQIYYGWSDESAFDYQNLQNPRGVGDCTYLDGKDMLWKAADCSIQLPFLCTIMPMNGTMSPPPANVTTTTPRPANVTTVTPPTRTPPMNMTTTPSSLTCLPANRQPLYTCKQGWQSFNGAQYMVTNDMNFNDGEAYCVSQGGHLASIHSKAENDFITNLCCASGCNAISPNSRYGQYLLGGYQQGGQPMWTDGTPFDYQQDVCYDENLTKDILFVSNYVSCDLCGQPGAWYWEDDQSILPYVVCKK